MIPTYHSPRNVFVFYTCFMMCTIKFWNTRLNKTSYYCSAFLQRVKSIIWSCCIIYVCSSCFGIFLIFWYIVFSIVHIHKLFCIKMYFMFSDTYSSINKSVQWTCWTHQTICWVHHGVSVSVSQCLHLVAGRSGPVCSSVDGWTNGNPCSHVHVLVW